MPPLARTPARCDVQIHRASCQVEDGQSGDRWRYTLAHELAHLIMHTVPHERMEDEADEFAAELLTPAEQIKPQLLQIKLTRSYNSPYMLRELARLKLYWRVSLQLLVYRARRLGVISRDEARRAYISLAPQRMVEAVPIEREPSNSLTRRVFVLSLARGYIHDPLASWLVSLGRFGLAIPESYVWFLCNQNCYVQSDTV